MRLTAKLTTGWDDKNLLGISAEELHQSALNGDDYINSLFSLLNQKKIDNIYQLEKLFRKSSKGFKPIKKFVGALSTIEDIEGKSEIACYINVFAYSFLKGAKNFDLLLPLDEQQDKKFIKTYQNWGQQIYDLENFERSGKEIEEKIKKQYLALREIVSRPSVRDEIRSLATLLISGPSTLNEVSNDIGLNYTLGQKTLGIFERIDVVKRQEQEKQKEKESTRYVIVKEALPVVIFCLRETIGLDLLRNLYLEKNYYGSTY
ncbi:hypothetical protein [Crocosphaera sp.]|uniref:hypothetical protein n=1 Tax=Crocosphaera sp. TaxID=2729996 RepID=UPI0026065B46|nr:hypothetical protein [Crocosphaera sp.]MDJ0582189.1 hypothetical protein [Crocosphaera sp.]